MNRSAGPWGFTPNPSAALTPRALVRVTNSRLCAQGKEREGRRTLPF